MSENKTNWMEDILLNKKFREKFESGEIQAMRYKGTVETFDDLPKTGNVAGDFWNVKDTGKNFAWNGKEWDDVSGIMEVPEATTTVSGTLKLGTSTTVSDAAGMIGKTSNGSAAVQFATNSLAGVVKLSSSKTGLNTTNAAAIGRNGSYQVFVPVATTSDNGSVKLATAITDAGAQSVPTASVVNAALAKKADLEELGNYVPLSGGNVEGDLRVGYAKNGTFYQAVGLNHQTGSADFAGILTAQIGDFANLRVFDRNESGAKVPVFTANPSGVSTSLNISTTGTLTVGGPLYVIDNGCRVEISNGTLVLRAPQGSEIGGRISFHNSENEESHAIYASNVSDDIYITAIVNAVGFCAIDKKTGEFVQIFSNGISGCERISDVSDLSVKKGGKITFYGETDRDKYTVSCTTDGDIVLDGGLTLGSTGTLTVGGVDVGAKLAELDQSMTETIGKVETAETKIEANEATIESLTSKIEALEARIAALEGASA